MAPRKAAAKEAPAVDLSAVEKGTRLQAEYDGVYYTAEVVTVSTAPKRSKAPIKVHYLGYTDDSDEWVSVDRVRSKAIKEAKKPKKEPKKSSSPDTGVVLYPYFDVPEGKMEEFKAGFKDFYDQIKPAEEKILYYGFAVDEENRKVMCREAYADAEGLLNHLKDVDVALKKALDIAKLESLSCHGPAAELEKLKEALTPLGCTFFALDPSVSKTFAYTTPTSWGEGKKDTSVVLYPYFDVKNMGAYKASLEFFTRKINPRKEGCIYYGFAVDEANNKALCREAYKTAQGFLTHLKNVEKPLTVALGLAELPRVEVHGPASELEKLKEALTPMGAKFFALDDGSKSWI